MTYNYLLIHLKTKRENDLRDTTNMENQKVQIEIT